MKLELSIKDDSEIRNLIKDMIRSQVVSIAREEIERSIISVIEDKTKSNKVNLKTIAELEIKKALSEALPSSYIKSTARDQIKSLVLEHMDEILKKTGIL